MNFRGTKFKTVIWQISRISEAHSDSKSMIWEICKISEAQPEFKSMIWEICEIYEAEAKGQVCDMSDMCDFRVKRQNF